MCLIGPQFYCGTVTIFFNYSININPYTELHLSRLSLEDNVNILNDKDIKSTSIAPKPTIEKYRHEVNATKSNGYKNLSIEEKINFFKSEQIEDPQFYEGNINNEYSNNNESEIIKPPALRGISLSKIVYFQIQIHFNYNSK
ncbi:hypothetical protein ACTFIV_006700 [Dictyostelium citrinum]